MVGSRDLYDKLLRSLAVERSDIVSQRDLWEAQVVEQRKKYQDDIESIEASIKEVTASRDAFMARGRASEPRSVIEEGGGCPSLPDQGSSLETADAEDAVVIRTGLSETEIADVVKSTAEKPSKTEKAKMLALFLFEHISKPMMPKEIVDEAAARGLNIESDNINELVRYALLDAKTFERPSRGYYWPKGWPLPAGWNPKH